MSMDHESAGSGRMDWDARRQAQHDRAFEVAQGLGEIPPWALTFMRLYAHPSRPSVEDVLADWPEDGTVPAPTADEAQDLIARLKAMRPARPAPRGLSPLPAISLRPFLDARSELAV
ncbi:hypothetical protein [Roseospira visakhapatnamensis]|uniref:Uncharacterized protein n=1 Tax=Roseospira visakhapatnamensis TaxID=390880 RepID=A0A7W6RBE7_9PROT|nr:hypothetical protein [Roseospira visakhapatnamensis]MBB4265404.1 hypothetical protein [Roseospira visakhapatnamensis]